MYNGLKPLTIILALLIAVALFCPSLTLAQGSFAPPADAAAPPAASPPAVPAAAAPGEAPVSDLDLNEDIPRAVHYDVPKIYKGERISLDFQNADLHNIVRIIGEVSGKNIVVSDSISGKVTLKLKDVPWDQALDIVLGSHNLGVEESGNVLNILNLDELNRRRTTREQAAAEQAARAALAPLSKKVFTPKYAPIGVVSEELKKLLTVRGKITSIGNDIYVEDDPGTLSTMTQIFLRIDKVARQILIEARIIEAASGFIEDVGVRWGVYYNGTGPRTGGLEMITPPGGGETSGGMDITRGAMDMGIGFLNKSQSLLLSARINATESSSETKTISAPRIMAANDQEVYIKQGYQVPYTTAATANSPATVEFKDVDMELRVKPHIEENGQIVTLEIRLTNNTINTDASLIGDGGEPAINTSEAETRLMVKDGETVVIGGILTDVQANNIVRVPGLYHIPILGRLFQNKDLNTTKKEMLIFITANIIPISI